MTREEIIKIVQCNTEANWQTVNIIEAIESYKQDIRAEVIVKIALKIQKIKDNHNENPRLYPINYGTLCGICTDLWEQLKENK